LNIGRLKLGPFAHGGCRDDIADSIRYAKERKAFGKSISEFGMIQHKIAEMAVRMFASESMTYRVVGAIEADMTGDNGSTMLKAVEEFASECSFIKVFASETLDYVVDECVQIHGGYGFSQEYSCEHAYRDSRINRIFEGTNEINRLLATGMMLKRAQKGTLPLVEAVKKLQSEILAGPQLGGEIDMVANAKKVGLFAIGVAFQKFLTALEEQQEVIANITDILMNAYAMESAALRAEKIVRSGKNADNAKDLVSVFSREAMDTIESAARTVLAACSEGDALRTNLAVLKRFTKYEPVNTIGLRRKIAARMTEAGKYTV
jgi:butyryl-CoA dehydrogenase